MSDDLTPDDIPVRGPSSWFSEESDSSESPLGLPHWTEPAPESAEAPIGARWRSGSGDYSPADDIRLLEDEPSDPVEQYFGGQDQRVASVTSDPRMSTGTHSKTGPARPASASGIGTGAVGGGRDMTTAIVTGLVLAAVAFGALYFSPLAAAILISVMLGLASVEFCNALRPQGYTPPNLLVFVASVGLSLGTYFYHLAAFPIVLSIATVFAFLWFILGTSPGRPVANLSITMLAITYVGVLGSFANLLLSSSSVVKDPETAVVAFESHGQGLLFAAIIVTAAYDTGALFLGQTFGRTPLSSHSPNKSVEGVIGGAIAAIAAAVVIVGLIGIAPWGSRPGSLIDSLVLGVIAAVAATIGDLSESMIKRDLGIKDMGNMLPGHGGLLDRFDSLLFVLPATWCAALVMGIIEAASVA